MIYQAAIFEQMGKRERFRASSPRKHRDIVPVPTVTPAGHDQLVRAAHLVSPAAQALAKTCRFHFSIVGT
jgi:hypothetical protein